MNSTVVVLVIIDRFYIALNFSAYSASVSSDVSYEYAMPSEIFSMVL